MAGLSDIEGISPAHAEKLKVQGLHTMEDLLNAGATPKSRGDLAAITGVSESLILRWTNMADLFRIKGVAEQYSDLLKASGVDTVPELAQRNPENLLAKMTQVNAEKGLVHRVPTQEQVTAWVAEAKTLPRMVSYGGEAGGARHEATAGSDTKSGAGKSGVRQAEAAATSAAPAAPMDQGLAASDAKSGDWDSGVRQAEVAATLANPQVKDAEPTASDTKNTAWDGGVSQAKTAATSAWGAPELPMDQGLTTSDMKTAASDSGVSQAKTAATSAAPKTQMDQAEVGSGAKGTVWDSGVRQAKTVATPSRTARNVHEWWGKRLWRYLRRPR